MTYLFVKGLGQGYRLTACSTIPTLSDEVVMLWLISLVVCYIFLQLNIALFKKKLAKWDDPKWMPALYAERQKQNKRHFIITWIVITILAMFMDVALGERMLAGVHNLGEVFLLLPVIFLLAILSFLKAEFLHMLYHTWGILNLKEKLKQQGKE
jgi:hypothetical protein